MFLDTVYNITAWILYLKLVKSNVKINQSGKKCPCEKKLTVCLIHFVFCWVSFCSLLHAYLQNCACLYYLYLLVSIVLCQWHRCSFLSECSKELDLTIVIDSSDSVKLRNFNLIKAFLVKLIGKYKISRKRTRVTLLIFSSKGSIRLIFPFMAYFNKQHMIERIKNLRYRPGSTFTGSALYEFRRHFNRYTTGARKSNFIFFSFSSICLWLYGHVQIFRIKCIF